MPNSTLFFITLCLSRVLVTFFFWMAGIYGVFHFAEIVQEMLTVGLPWPVLFAAGTIFCQLAGSALIVFNPAGYGWIGSVMLIVFTLLTIPLGHASGPSVNPGALRNSILRLNTLPWSED